MAAPIWLKPNITQKSAACRITARMSPRSARTRAGDAINGDGHAGVGLLAQITILWPMPTANHLWAAHAAIRPVHCWMRRLKRSGPSVPVKSMPTAQYITQKPARSTVTFNEFGSIGESPIAVDTTGMSGDDQQMASDLMTGNYNFNREKLAGFLSGLPSSAASSHQNGFNAKTK